LRRVTLEDWPVIEDWFNAHGNRVAKLPPTGFIIDGVAAVFLTKTDSGVAFAEAYITNPQASSQDRSAAIDVLIVQFIREARDCGFSSLIAITVDQGLCARAVERHGFTYVGAKHGLIREL